MINEINEPYTGIKQRTYILYTKYINEIISRMTQYKDDLLVSCLKLVLSSPNELISLNDFIEPLKIILKLGIGE